MAVRKKWQMNEDEQRTEKKERERNYSIKRMHRRKPYQEPQCARILHLSRNYHYNPQLDVLGCAFHDLGVR